MTSLNRHRPADAGLASAPRPNTLFDLADELALQVATSCFRSGRCHECVVEVTDGLDALAPRTDAESYLRGDFRLACQAAVMDDDARIAFQPLRRRPQILTLSWDKPLPNLNPVVRCRDGQVFHDDVLIDRFRGHVYGLAIDLGTTTVVMDLMDLTTGESLHVSAFENPQRFGGSDIMHRISFDGADPERELHRAVTAAINQEIREMCRAHDFKRQEIYEIVVAGNSTMRDILFKIDVQSIGQKPYKSIVEHEYLAGERDTTALIDEARNLGLLAHPKARVYGLPLIACHVGADAAADLIAVDLMDDPDGTVMVVDVGTNTEVVIGNRERMIATSCPAGPAFEGGLIRYGMPGRDGAVESIRLHPNGECADYRTIGEVAPEGICGSGLIDLLAELRRHEILTAKGVFARDRKQFDITVLPEHGITFSKEDASNLGQAKAANYCGQLIAMRTLGVNPADVTRLYLAGGFANYVDIDNAIEIGFLPPVPRDRIVKVGNAAILGAREVLLSRKRRTALELFVKRIEHVELETTPDFFEVFVDGCQFQPMPDRIVS